MERRRMVRRRLLLAAKAAVVIVLSMLLFRTDHGSLDAYMAPQVFSAKNSSYDTELWVRDSCADPGPGAAHADVLLQSYTENLSYMLTAKRSRPSVTDLDQLLTDGDYIGYQTAGFRCPLLMNKGIEEDNNQTEYPKFLSKGSKNSGGSATVDFCSDGHCKAYEMADGLGFVFPDKTSPVVHDVSVDAIFNVAEGYDGSQIEGIAIVIRKEMQMPLGAENDFEVSYTETGVSSLAPAHNDSKPPIQWMILRPLTKELWLTTVCFVVFTGFVVWMIERSINPVFQGSSLTQLGTALYFAFSTLTFSHGQILRSPLSKIVLLVWCFAVLVLVQSYITNLASMLAAEASPNNGTSSAAGSAPLTLRSFSGLFVVVGCISTSMLLIRLAGSVYANYARARRSESQSVVDEDGGTGSVRPEGFIGTPQANNASAPDQHVQEVRDNEEAGRIEEEDSMSNGSEPVPEVSIQIEMTSTGNAVGSAL